MEKKLFDWKGWDELDSMTFLFTDCELRVPIGEFPIGTKAGYIVVDYERGELRIALDPKDEKGRVFKIELVVV